MAYVPGYNTEMNEEQAKRRQNALTRASAPGGDVSVTSAPSAPAPKQDRGTGFVNLEKYLELNSGGGDAMGQAVAAEADQVGRQAQQSLDRTQNEFTQKSQQSIPGAPARTTFQPKAIDRKSPSYIMDVMYGPGKVATDEELAQAKALSESKYTGPSSIKDTEGYAATKSAFDRAKAGGQELNSEDVRQDVLAQKVASPRGGYTQGQRGLDSFLASQSQGGKRAITDARTRWSNVDQLLGGAEAQSLSAGKAAEQKAKDAAALGARTLANAEAAQRQQDAAWAAERKYQEELARRTQEEFRRKKPVDQVGGNWSVLASDWNVGP